MDVMKSQLQGLLARARTWEPRIKKTTFCESVNFTCTPETGEFSITASWKNRSGEVGSYTKHFTRELVFGPPHLWGSQPRVRRAICAFMREFMQEILHSRGV